MNFTNEINIVKNDILSRFPNCAYTIMVTLWDNNELTFYEIDINGKVMVRDEYGNEKFMYLNEERI